MFLEIYFKKLFGMLQQLIFVTQHTVGSTTNSMNFSESGWSGRILSAMKVLIPIVIGLLVVGCGKKTSKPEAKTKSTS